MAGKESDPTAGLATVVGWVSWPRDSFKTASARPEGRPQKGRAPTLGTNEESFSFVLAAPAADRAPRASTMEKAAWDW